MQRTQIYLDEDQDSKLKKRAAAAGVTKSSLIRAAVDELLRGPEDEKGRVVRFRSAVRRLAASPLELPGGASYVEALRSADVARQEELDRRRK